MLHPEAKIGAGTFIWFRELSNIGNIECGTGCNLHSHIWVADGVRMGSRVTIQAFAFIPYGVSIGNDVFIGPRVTFCNDKYPPSDRSRWLPVVVEDGVLIGAGAIILPGVTLGKGCRIGAGSVVTKSVPAGVLVYGVPAEIHPAELDKLTGAT